MIWDYKRYSSSNYTMNNKLFLRSFAAMFIVLATISGGASSVNAQGDSNTNNSKSIGMVGDSASGVNTTSLENSPSIITPWNTGNDKNNDSASSPG